MVALLKKRYGKRESMSRWLNEGKWEGADLSSDFLNVGYAQAVKAGATEEAPKDCGHKSCGLLCDVLIRQVRGRRGGR